MITSRARHARVGPEREGSGAVIGRRAKGNIGDYVLWHTTKRRPWTKRRENRARNKRARAARRANRRRK